MTSEPGSSRPTTMPTGNACINARAIWRSHQVARRHVVQHQSRYARRQRRRRVPEPAQRARTGGTVDGHLSRVRRRALPDPDRRFRPGAHPAGHRSRTADRRARRTVTTLVRRPQVAGGVRPGRVGRRGRPRAPAPRPRRRRRLPAVGVGLRVRARGRLTCTAASSAEAAPPSMPTSWPSIASVSLHRAVLLRVGQPARAVDVHRDVLGHLAGQPLVERLALELPGRRSSSSSSRA